MRPQLLITFCLLWQICSLKAQSLNYMPPTPGGFEVLVTTKYLPATTELMQDGRTDQGFFTTSSIQTDLRCQYALSKSNWVLYARLPLFHQLRQTVLFLPIFNLKQRGFSNVELAARYQLGRPELIGTKKYLITESKILLPPTVGTDDLLRFPLGYEGFTLENGLFVGRAGQHWLFESGVQLGLRPQYKDYVTAYGKCALTLSSWQLALTLNGRLPLYWKDGMRDATPTEVLYHPEQAYLIGGFETIWNPSRFLGLSISVGKVLTGDQILNYTALGAGVYVRWN